MKTKRDCLFAAVLAIFFAPAPMLLGGEPEKIWEQLNKLPAQERQTFLLSKAREEKEVVWYTTIGFQYTGPLVEGFQKHYPGIEVKAWWAGGERVLNRVLNESRAGKFDVDIVSGGNEFFPALMKADLVGRYNSPEREFYSDIYKDQEGYWTSFLSIVAIMAYNSEMVPSPKIPKRYEDFLDPKWKGNFAIDADPDRAMMGWLKIWGNERTEKFLKGLIKNQVAVRRGHTLIAQLLCAGEFEGALEVYIFRMAELKAKGCPIQPVFPDPSPGAVSPLFVAKRSPHPHAAALLVDYLLSESGQKILAENGRLVGRSGIKPKYPEMDLERDEVRLLLLRPEDAEQFGPKYFELRERYLSGR